MTFTISNEDKAKATDILIDFEGDPASYDVLYQQLGAALLDGGNGYIKHEGYYVARCFGDPQMFEFMVNHQGYGVVIRLLDELL